MAQTDSNAGAADRESVHARVLDASRERVFHAFREPEHFAQWWGPKGFRSTIHSFDFRPGGRLQLTLHGPDGADYENEYLVEEIVERERIVISHSDPGHYFQLFITLAEEGEQNAVDLASAVRYPRTFRASESDRGRGERTKSGSACGGTEESDV
jgi:uncharacterized protein YndB with AHSA1/START domain